MFLRRHRRVTSSGWSSREERGAAVLISDRGTYSAEHISRWYRHGYYALCSMRWNDSQAVFDAHADRLKDLA